MPTCHLALPRYPKWAPGGHRSPVSISLPADVIVLILLRSEDRNKCSVHCFGHLRDVVMSEKMLRNDVPLFSGFSKLDVLWHQPKQTVGNCFYRPTHRRPEQPMPTTCKKLPWRKFWGQPGLVFGQVLANDYQRVEDGLSCKMVPLHDGSVIIDLKGTEIFSKCSIYLY